MGLFDTTSTYASMVAATNPVELMLLKLKKEQEARASRHAKARPRSQFMQGEPRRPLWIGTNGKCTYRAPDVIARQQNGKPVADRPIATSVMGKDGKPKTIPVVKAIPRAIAKKMRYNAQRAELGRWTN